MSDTDILRALADCRAITELIHRYCRAFDRFTCEVHEKKVLAHSHQISNVLIELNGDHAASEAYLTAVAAGAETGRRDRTDASYAVFNVA